MIPRFLFHHIYGGVINFSDINKKSDIITRKKKKKEEEFLWY